VKNKDAPDDDLIDRIANALPAEVRPDYYRELRHCRSLPENDELLRLIRAMQFLTLLMEQVPARIVVEREQLDRLLGTVMDKLEKTLMSSVAYQTRLDERLSALPAEVAEGIAPEAIVAIINESLRQQFVRTTIPETAGALAAVAAELRTVPADFRRTSVALGDAYRGAVAQAHEAIEKIDLAIYRAAETARNAAADLSSRFQREYRWSLYALSSLALVIGLILGILFQRWLDTPVRPVQQDNAPHVQTRPR
jgi:hypothetical protein